MIPKLRPHVFKLITQFDLEFTFIDIGSRNGVLELGDLAQWVHAFGFEPNPAEYEKLLREDTDAFVLSGIKPPPYKSLVYDPRAVTNSTGTSEFYVTPGPGAAGALEPDIDRL